MSPSAILRRDRHLAAGVACDGLADDARRAVAMLGPMDVAASNVIVMGDPSPRAAGGSVARS